ncbi:AfsR/SARP family transcriptional regulator [Allorhizocola rhizosphaerae]|uniref:AfsR/SARP family transcriptional regulator n=1 Tax=Allorhizocola rhizosphaerae TaxID=1872709 RepID=UPI0013C35432|nr:BTAD domain-containing putative transcriptional regulator [Allorhizocola rhizosphaerae]
MNPHIQLLGPVRAWLDDTELELGPARQKGLLALLALAAGQPLSRAHLAEALWGAERPPSHANIIQVYVARLRRAFEPDRPARSPSHILRSVGDGYALAVEPESVDALRLRRALAEAARARRAGDHERVRQLLEPALASWRHPLQGAVFFTDQSTISSLVDDRWTAVAWLAAAAIETGGAAGVLAPLQETAAARPWDEMTQALLVRALHAVGRKGEAIDAYRRIRQTLREELGVEPGHELAEAFAAALSDADAPAERGFVVSHLPPRAERFAGRTTELETLRDKHLVCIEGPPGMGKTSLALELAHLFAPEDRLFIDLRGLGRSGALISLLRCLGADESRLPRDRDELAARYRAAVAGRRLLIVLDNASGTEQVLPLLPASPSCAVIVTSHHDVADVPGHHHQLGPLSESDALSLLPRTATDVAKAVARLCDGNPLALRIAGAQLRADPEGLPEARGVHGAFLWAYRALSKSDARAFRLLSLHPGASFAADLVAALANQSAGAAARLLDRLSGAHLIEPAGHARYRFHDLVRDFATELLEEHETLDQRDAARHRLLEWYLVITDGANRVLNPQLDQVTLRPDHHRQLPFTADRLSTLDYLSAEADNFPVVVRDAALHGFDTECWQLAYILSHLPSTRTADLVRSADWGLRAARRTGDRRAEAVMLGVAGTAAFQVHRPRDASDLHRRQIAIWQEQGEPAQEAMAWYQLGAAHCALRRHADSLAAYQRGLDLTNSLGDPVQSGFMLGKVGYKARDLGDLALSERCLRRALAIWRELGDARGESHVLHELGKTRLAAGDRTEAIELLSAAHRLGSVIGEEHLAAHSLYWTGRAHVRAGQAHSALDVLEQAQELFARLGDEHGEAAALTALGSVLTTLDDLGTAQEHLKRARALRDRAPDPLEEGMLHDAISTLAARMGDARRAQAHRAAANTKFTESGCFEARQLIA